MFFRDLNLDKKDILYLLIIFIFASLVCVNSIYHYIHLNVKSDVLVYLVNGLFYSGLNDNIQSTSSMFLSPVICYLTGLVFRIWYVNRVAIFVVTGAFCVLGTLGMYVFLKIRFNRFLSLFGSVLFASFSLLLSNWSNGAIDVPAIAVSTWTIIFLILAVDKNPKYYILTSVLLVVSIFTRYTAFFLIPLILLYYLSKHDFFDNLNLLLTNSNKFTQKFKTYIKSREFKYIVISVVLATVLFAGACILITQQGSGLTFITQTSDSVSGFQGSNYSSNYGYTSDDAYYVINFMHMLYFDKLPVLFVDFSHILMFLLLVSLAIHIIGFARDFDEAKKLIENRKRYLIRHFDKLLLIAILVLAAVMILGFYKNNNILSNVALLTIIVISFSLLKKLDIESSYYRLNLFCIGWFLVYFIFFSLINIKTPRYMIAIVPPLIYFIVLAVESILISFTNGKRPFEFKSKNSHRIAKILIIAAIAFLMVHAVTYEVKDKNAENDNKKLNKLFDFLVDYDPDYADKNITSDHTYSARYGTWHMKKDVIRNITLFEGTPTEDYIVTNHTVELDNYNQIYKSGKIRLYERI